MAGTAVVVLATPTPASAVLGDKPLISYNMQGATSGQDSKWTTTVGGYIRQTEVVALQEAGPVPPGAFVQNIALPGVALPQVGLGNVVQHHRWQFGFESYEVYFLQTDARGGAYTGGRVNTALVTQREADEVTAVPSPVQNGRAALGVRFGDTWYFSFHARSMGNQPNDAAAMIAQVNATIAARGLNENWVVLGDFNREPNQLGADLLGGQGIAPPIYAARDANGGYLPTQQSGRALDYAVARENVNGVQANRLAGASADHYAFAFGALRGGAEPNVRYHSDRAVEGMQAGGVLDAARGGTGNFTNIISYHRNGGDNQAWSLDFYNDNTVRFRGRQSQRCIDIRNSNTAAAGRPLVLWDCTDQASQRWHVDAAGDSEVNLRSVLRPDLCMDVAGAPRQPDAGNVIVWGCQDSVNQRWLLTPADATYDIDREPIDLSRNYEGPATLEGLEAGGVADAYRGRTGNNTPIISYHRDGGSNQGWYLDWFSSNQVRIRGVGSSSRCIDIHNSNTATAGRELVLWDCTYQASQQWRAELLDNGQMLLHNASRPDLCMDIAGAPHTPDAGNLIVWPCTAAVNQQFILTAYDPTGTPEPDREHSEL
ncbi:MAG TPA: RICIN domain-containing protein [Mycobacteriales bacterium]|nr:RICIN domain-containing protein [Mycobacteriales bacterium]